MEISIPIVVHETRRRAGGGQHFRLWCLFFPELRADAEDLARGQRKLVTLVRKHIQNLNREGLTRELADLAWCPEVNGRNLKFHMILRRRTAQMRVFAAVFSAVDRRIAVVPTLRDFWFEIPPGKSLTAYAEEVFTHYFRQEEKAGADGLQPERACIEGKIWLHTIDLDEPAFRGALPKPEATGFAALFESRPMSGAAELDATSQNLNALYPDELPRAILRDSEVAELKRLLAEPVRRPVLLLGASQIGKTALLQEVVWQRVHERKKKHSRKRNVWLLSPQRLISGMMYVGQWEERLLAILQEAKKRDHVLVFEDVLGLYFAGQSANSTLSMAEMLKPHLERQEIRLVAEMTPEAFRLLQERDRGMADLFHVIRVQELQEAETLQVMLATIRRLEMFTGSRFESEVIQAVMEIQKRYAPGRCFPGKAVRMLTTLASRNPKQRIDRQKVLDHFRSHSGLDRDFLDPRLRLNRREITSALNKLVFGQPQAVEALADAIGVAKAQLNEPGRPLANFLFVGPSGVGKTEAAKAAATYLYGSPERLLRFDMNEYVEAFAVPRLIGNAHQPEGLLTQAIRRQPFCVLLLDEIEKAHPELFDLLLQVLGEGRLTDALGRTVDFSYVMVILTSNLGVREATQSLGFDAEANASRANHYESAVQKFFRPEFFNRIDRVVPFSTLGDEELREIADRVLNDILDRDGLHQRRCVLDVSPAATERVVAMGRDPLLGARTLKRQLEEKISQPVARKLAAMPPGLPSVVRLRDMDDELQVEATVLKNAEANPLSLNRQKVTLNELATCLERLTEAVDARAPKGSVATESISPEARCYFAMRDQLQIARELWFRLRESPRKAPGFQSQTMRHSNRRRYAAYDPLEKFPELMSRRELDLYFDELASEPFEAGLQQQMLMELAVLQLYLKHGDESCHLGLEVIGPRATGEVELLKRMHKGVLESLPGIIQNEEGDFVGPAARQFARIGCGTWLVIDEKGSLLPVVRQLPDEPFVTLPDILQLKLIRKRLVDFRSGLTVTDYPTVQDLRWMWLSQLPCPLKARVSGEVRDG